MNKSAVAIGRSVARSGPQQPRRIVLDAASPSAGIVELAPSPSRTRRYLDVLLSRAFVGALVAALTVGWLYREEGPITPGHGVGYWLGISGVGAMLLLLVYPLRKRYGFMRSIGTVPFWFRFHMVLGLVGPTLILLHSDFRFDAINSQVALVAMLTVAASGLIGRYLYYKINSNFHGRRAKVRDFINVTKKSDDLVDQDTADVLGPIRQMIEVADAVASPPRGALARLWVWPVVLMRVHIARWRLLANARRLIEQDDQRRGGNRHTRRQRLSGVRALVDLHFSNVTSAARLAFFERVFAMWHLMHLPLFLLMVLAVVAHVVAVHLY